MKSPFLPGAKSFETEGHPFDEPLEAPGGGTAGGGALSCSPGPLPSPAALDLAATKGLADVMARRAEQWLKFGHTPEADAKTPLHYFARELASMVAAVQEDSLFGRPLPLMRKHTVTLAAFALALVDRIDAEPPEEDFPPL